MEVGGQGIGVRFVQIAQARGQEDRVIVVIHNDCPLHKVVRKPTDDVLGDE